MPENNPNSNHTQTNGQLPQPVMGHAATLSYETVRNEYDMRSLIAQLAATDTLEPEAIQWRGRRHAKVKRAPAWPQIDPLLLSGSGGTARKVLTFFKAKGERRFGPMPDHVSIKVFDSGSERFIVRDPVLGNVELEPEREYIHLGRVPMAGIKRWPEFHPYLTSRIGAAYPHIYQTMLSHGAGQVRAQGLIYFYYHIAGIVDALQSAITRITRRGVGVNQDAEASNETNLVVIGSTSGGQGSGTILDLAALLRHLVGNVATGRLFGMLALPSAFGNLSTQAAGRNTVSNHIAFTKDLNFLMANPELRLEYSSLHHVEVNEPPFDQLFVFEGIDEKGQSWSSADGLFAMMADVLLHMFCEDVGREERAYAVNGWNFQQTGAGGYGDYIGTAGLAELRFPGGQIAVHHCVRHACQVLEYAMTPGNARALPAFIAPTAEQISRALMGEHTQVSMIMPAHLREAKPADMVNLARSQVDHALRQRVHGHATAQIAENASALSAEMAEQLNGWFGQIAPSGHLPDVVQVLHQAHIQVEALYGQLAARHQEHAQILAGHRERMTDANERLENVAKQSFLQQMLFGGEAIAAVQVYYRAAQDRAEGEILDQIYSQAQSLVRHLLKRIAQRITQAEEAGTRVRQIRERLAQIEKRVSDYTAEHNSVLLVDEDLLDAIYTQQSPDPAHTLKRLATHPTVPLLSWGEEGFNPAVRGLLQVIAPHFASTSQMSVEDILQEYWPERSVEQWIAILENMAAGAWNVDAAKLPPGISSVAEYLTLGVPERTKSIFAATNHTLMDTGDRQRILALRTIYGGRLDALKATPEWERIYEKSLPHMRPSPHIFPQIQEGSEALETRFGVGLCFQIIVQRGNYFHFVPADGLLSQVQLGNGLENALAALQADATTVQDLQTRIDTEIERRGKDTVQAQLLAFIDDHTERSDENWRHLLRKTRAYAESL